MAEVMNMPPDSVDQSPKPSANDDVPPPVPAPAPPPPPRRRERDGRDERDVDRPPNRRDYYERNASPQPRGRERDYKRRRSPSPPPYRDRRYSSPPRRSPPPFKRSRRGSPRGGYGPEDRWEIIWCTLFMYIGFFDCDWWQILSAVNLQLVYFLSLCTWLECNRRTYIVPHH